MATALMMPAMVPVSAIVSDREQRMKGQGSNTDMATLTNITGKAGKYTEIQHL